MKTMTLAFNSFKFTLTTLPNTLRAAIKIVFHKSGHTFSVIPHNWFKANMTMLHMKITFVSYTLKCFKKGGVTFTV